MTKAIGRQLSFANWEDRIGRALAIAVTTLSGMGRLPSGGFEWTMFVLGSLVGTWTGASATRRSPE